jgi:cephalosporin hydroxylase
MSLSSAFRRLFHQSRYPTDKISNGLMDEYEKAFRRWTHQPIALLEIGIYRGGSVRYWDAFFRHPGTKIVGIDRRIPEMKCSPRVITYVCDQNDREGLLKIARDQGPFHVIIDDASHMSRETRTCFDTLYPHLVPGGFYALEDWAVGYWSDQLPEYAGMIEVVTGIIQDAPKLNIGAYRVIAETGCLALFQKDVVPFRDKPVPPGLDTAEKHYSETVAVAPARGR